MIITKGNKDNGGAVLGLVLIPIFLLITALPLLVLECVFWLIKHSNNTACLIEDRFLNFVVV